MSAYKKGDHVQLKKAHACGQNDFSLDRIGVDIKLTCQGCGQILWFRRLDFEKRLRKIRNAEGKFVPPDRA